MTNNNGVPFPLVISGLIPICLSLANLVNGCNKRYYESLLKQRELEAKVECIQVADRRIYTVNATGQTNYFQYVRNGKYTPCQSQVNSSEARE